MKSVCAILVHVSDVTAALIWYRQAFPDAVLEVSQPSGFEFLRVGSIQLEIVPADEKVASGAAGSVVYWAVKDFQRALDHLIHAGGVLYRGPLEIDGELWMCQVRDPWGNCIGLRGPMTD
ncbi:VOC family protein [Oryzicola mucosus]|uniref:Glyoxalase/bleomycin resistance/dioxygenase family protein n=1 Tax=Oryzicola mucosus TaxID=2767425 RepID=A0A8J6PTV3_9HYPH|nr:glyoxalase/bleomycin resistance/dioxygenase family protein [Oryzicola mucosus]MBD0413492.1 glyoxalase/bleomycin resistance/dioxygenase family protein [Oryzicola mucosus]